MKFFYKARNQTGQDQKGEIEASSKKAALDVLEKHGLYVVSLQTGAGWRGHLALSFGTGVSSKDLVMFTRQFSIMLKSAIPPLEALRALILQTTNQAFKQKLIKMAEALETGSALSRALSLENKIFNPFYVNMVKSGEATGKMADALNYLAEHLERDYNLKGKIRGAMIYPVFVISAFVGAFFLATFFIIPRLTQILTSFQGKLPLSTQLIMGMATFVRGGGWVLVLVFFLALFVAPFALKRFPTTKKIYDKYILKVPIMGNFKKKVYLTQFSENLSVLVAAGLPITQALKITKDIIGNTTYQLILERAEDRVSRGEKISSILGGFPEQFPAFVTQMVATGEETGRLEDTLINVVKFYQEDLSRTAENLTAILEPILILCLGAGIGVLAVGLFLPLFKIGMGGV
ncbi:MAG: type II secretion system F family protein [Patescibacteria group bacterium]